MSTNLFVSLEEPISDPPDVAFIAREARSAAKRVPNRLLQGVRLELRKEPFGYSIEPFVGSAALAALIARRATSGDARELLAAIVSACTGQAGLVGVAFLDAGPDKAEHWPEAKFVGGLDEVITAAAAEGIWAKLEPTLWEFVVPRVEARLWDPLPLAGHEPAVGYFCDYVVRAKSVREAIELIRADLQSDAAALIRAEVTGRHTLGASDRASGSAAVVEKSGRVFFSEA